MTSENYIVKGTVTASGDVEADVYATDIGWTTERGAAKVFDDSREATLAAAEYATQSVASCSYWYVVDALTPDPRDVRIAALEEEVTNLKATIAVREGEWCRGNREEGRGGCGVCPWCMRTLRDEVERLRAENATLRARLDDIVFIDGTDAFAVSQGRLRVGDVVQIPETGGDWPTHSWFHPRGKEHVVKEIRKGRALFSTGFLGDVGASDFPLSLVKRRGEP